MTNFADPVVDPNDTIPDDYPWAPTGIYFGVEPVTGISPYTGEVVTISYGEQLTPDGVINNAQAQAGANVITDIMTSILQSRPQMNAVDAYRLAYTAQVNGHRILNGSITIAQAVDELIQIAAAAPDVPVTQQPPTGDAIVTSVTIKPPHAGEAGLLPVLGPNILVGPDGRSWLEIKQSGTYLSFLEREWFLNRTGLTTGLYDAFGIPIPGAIPLAVPIPLVGPDGRTYSQITGTAYRSAAEQAWYLNIQAYLNGAPPVQITAQVLTQPQGVQVTPTGNTRVVQSPAGQITFSMDNNVALFPAAVEQWRTLVASIFPDWAVQAILWCIAFESAGIPNVQNGVYYGLLQSDAPGAHTTDVRQQLLSAYNDKFIPSQASYPAGQGLAPWGYNNNPVHGGLTNYPLRVR